MILKIIYSATRSSESPKKLREITPRKPKHQNSTAHAYRRVQVGFSDRQTRRSNPCRCAWGDGEVDVRPQRMSWRVATPTPSALLRSEGVVPLHAATLHRHHHFHLAPAGVGNARGSADPPPTSRGDEDASASSTAGCSRRLWSVPQLLPSPLPAWEKRGA